MKKWKYAAMDSKGSEIEGIVDADTQADAVSLIRAKGLFPTRVSELNATNSVKGACACIPVKIRSNKLAEESKRFLWPAARVSSEELSEFARKTATLMESGVPLLRGLHIIMRQEQNRKLAKAIQGMGDAIEGGSTFSEALAMYPRIFNKTFINMAKAGEAGGVLDITMSRLADYLDKENQIKCSIITSFFFISISAFVVAVLLSILGMSLALNPILMGAIVFAVFAVKIATIYRKINGERSLASFARILGTLMGCGVPVLQALNITRDTSRTRAFRKATQAVHDAVKEGDTISAILEDNKCFPSIATNMIDVGEETGALPEMLGKIAEIYEKNIEYSLTKLNLYNNFILSIAVAVIAVLSVIK